MITANPARALGLEDYGLAPGRPASLVVYEAPTESDLIQS